MQKTSTNITEGMEERPPIVVVMGHVDHGKSTLLDYIRKTNTTDKEIGGITQRLSAYEVIHEREGKPKKITFLDTPGHEAFQGIRARGVKVADIAILVVSAEDGVKPQTLEALKTIRSEEMPFIVAINKIDKPGANIDRTKQNLAEHDIFIESYGGTIPSVEISAKTGQGISDLLEMILLVAELEELKATQSHEGEGIIIETHVDKKKGNTAAVIITDGTFVSGTFAVAGGSFSPIRIFEDFTGRAIKAATFSSPVKIIGWNTLPAIGEKCFVVASKKEAEEIANKYTLTQKAKSSATQNKKASQESTESTDIEPVSLPLIIKASDMGGLEAIIHEIAKIKNPTMKLNIVEQAIGDISEKDIKTAASVPGTIILGFNIAIDGPARALAENQKTNIQRFDIIYKLSEWLEEYVREHAPKKKVEETKGIAKILKTFSRIKDRQIIGGRVESGTVKANEEVKILRRDNEIGRGRIRELQQQKDRVGEIAEGKEFGAMLESKIELVPGDRIECFAIVEK